MALDHTEVILFHRPDENRKNIFISNIETDTDEVNILTTLRNAFMKHGLINEVLVFKSHLPNFTRIKPKNPANENSVRHLKERYYAIVKFYSILAAATALKNMRLEIDGQLCKLSYSMRKDVATKQQLYVTKCYELANYYLGFDGWSVTIKKMWMEDSMTEVKCVCHVDLSITHHSLVCTGVGVWLQLVTCIETKGQMCSKTHKIAYNRAVENAFSKLILLVMPDGRVYADVNVANDVELQAYADDIHPLQVKEASGRLDNSEFDPDTDKNNINILEQLEDS